MFRPITYAPRGRMSHSVATLSASLARGSPMCQPCSSRPRLPRGFSRLWSGPATKPSSEIDMWQVVSDNANLPVHVAVTCSSLPNHARLASGSRSA